jgi:hypothetical protein
MWSDPLAVFCVRIPEREPVALFNRTLKSDALVLADELNVAYLEGQRDANADLLAACKDLIEEARIANELIEAMSTTANLTLADLPTGWPRYNTLVGKRDSHLAAIAKAGGAA